jgi:glycosyltransferase involved in cell wall biosynthesis
MRYWELARVLAREFPVVLAAPSESSVPSSDSDAVLETYRRYDDGALRPLVDASEVVIAPGDSLLEFPFLLSSEKHMVMDGYDPHTLESLAWNENSPLDVRMRTHQDRLHILSLQCAIGDYFICASERQRMLWLGWLEAMGRVNPYTYDQDHALRALIDVVPTGFPTEPAERTQPLVRGVIPGIGLEDPLLVWGGGIWNWLDPLTLIEAVARVVGTRPDVRLYFPGPRHPYQEFVPDMAMHQAAVQLSKELGLSGRNVFWGEWVPYHERQNYLLEADIGCSLHYETVETYFAFRTRVLDYLWAGLPMLVTQGDAASDLVREYDLGIVVDYEDVDGVAAGILQLLSAPGAGYRERFEEARRERSWQHSARPLARFCQNPRRAPDRGASCADGYVRSDVARAVRQDQEIERLRSVILGYEGGRFIRFTRWLNQTRHRLRGRG